MRTFATCLVKALVLSLLSVDAFAASDYYPSISGNWVVEDKSNWNGKTVQITQAEATIVGVTHPAGHKGGGSYSSQTTFTWNAELAPPPSGSGGNRIYNCELKEKGTDGIYHVINCYEAGKTEPAHIWRR